MKPALYTLIFFLLAVNTGFSQIQFWSDTFEDAGAPSTGSRTPSCNFSCTLSPSVTPTSYFTRAAPAALNLAGTYSGFQGSKVWAGENLDIGGGTAGSCVESSQSFIQTVGWSVNITGKAGLSFKGFFAANSISAGNWDSKTAQPTNYDFLIIEYQIDAGAWTKIIEFYASNTSTSTTLALDTDADFVGNGTALSHTFAEFAANIAGTGTTLNLRFNASSNNSSNEEFAVDNFRLFAITSLPVELSTFISQCEHEKEIVSWTSQTETHLQSYELESTENGELYQTIAKVAAAGMSETPLNYSVAITESFHQQLYYRLKTIDLDGTFEYSDMISSENCVAENRQLLKSFSAKDGTLMCMFSSTELSYELLTPEGNSVTGKRHTQDQQQSLVANNLGQGMYLLRVSDDRNAEQVYRIFIE